MSAYSFHSSRPIAEIGARPRLDASRRRQIYGPIQPMDGPSLLERLFGRH